MIHHTNDNLLHANAQALVNTVNCVGFMGKGIALQFKRAWPANFNEYVSACQRKEIQPGHMFVFNTGRMINPKFIFNFPTKRHWRENSRLTDIASGLIDLVAQVRRLEIRSIAIPPLGCGNGGLNWPVVRSMIENAFAQVPEVDVFLHSPIETHGAHVAPLVGIDHTGARLPEHSQRPAMTTARALFIKLMQQYEALDYRRTLLEIQKLAYFLQEAGEPLRLRYEAGHYGPYATNLNKVLQRIEGHFIRGYSDSHKPDLEIDLMPGAVDEANAFLSERGQSLSRLERVHELIQGFQTPYGMELLSSVHWVAVNGKPRSTTVDAATVAVHSWNERKKSMFRAQHIATAFQRLTEKLWLA